MSKPIKLEVHLGESGIVLGTLYLNNERRTGFGYSDTWLQHPKFFNISPDLQAVSGIQYPQHVFFLALQDTAPDSWGERVIRRAHAKQRQINKNITPLMPTDFLLWVDDEARMGALRVYDADNQRYLHSGTEHRHIPPLMDLGQVLSAATALEAGTENLQDLQYLLGRGTSLGGARPKSTVRDLDGTLALGKFPSQADQRDVIRGEVLAMQLATLAGINAARTRVEIVNQKAVAIITRFDRTQTGARIPYLSAASMLQSTGRDQEHAYTELVQILLQRGSNPIADIHQLWRRLVFNYLICNTDDHLHNTGFLYDAKNKGWRLSPAFDLNPMPNDLRESKTWLTEDSGPINNKKQLLEEAVHFRLHKEQAETIWKEVEATIRSWKTQARKLKMDNSSLIDFEAAFSL